MTHKEITYLTKRKHKTAYFYMLPKLHKSEYINTILSQNEAEYIHIPDFSEPIDGRPIVGGPAYQTSGLSEMIDILLTPVIKYVGYLLKDSFHFLEKIEKDPEVSSETLLVTCDIKSLYTNISHDLAFKALDYWITSTWDFIDPENRFQKPFIMEALMIVLTCNFFYFCGTFWKQLSGFAMGTKCAVKCANLVVAYIEEKMFILLPTVYPRDFVEHFIRSYLRFLDDLFMKWLKGFDIEKLYRIFDELDPALKFIFSEMARNANYLDIAVLIKENIMQTSVYHKPTDSFNYLHYESCHPRHTRDNIAVSLAKRIIRITSDEVKQYEHLSDLRSHLECRGHPKSSIDRAYLKVFSPKHEDKLEKIVFATTHNPKHVYQKGTITHCLDNLSNPEMLKTFGNYKVISSYRQAPNLGNILIRSRFDMEPNVATRTPNIHGLRRCHKCIYCISGNLRDCKSFTFGKYNEYTWYYTRNFSCNSKNVIYLIKCHHCWRFYIGQTKDTKKRIRKHKSDVLKPCNSYCKKLSKHLHDCSKLEAPYFEIYPFLYEDDESKRRFLEKRMIKKYNPPLNGDK